MKTPLVCVTGSLLLTLGFACTATSSKSDGPGPVPPECAVTELEVDERDCGTYEITEVPCEDEGDSLFGGTDSAGETGTTGGAGDSGGTTDECAEREASNAAVVSCILGAEADGVAVTFGFESDEIVFVYRSQYHVAADGSMWRSYDDLIDLCQASGVEVYGAVELGLCGDWACIHNELDTAVLVASCESQQSCYGG